MVNAVLCPGDRNSHIITTAYAGWQCRYDATQNVLHTTVQSSARCISIWKNGERLRQSIPVTVYFVCELPYTVEYGGNRALSMIGKASGLKLRCRTLPRGTSLKVEANEFFY